MLNFKKIIFMFFIANSSTIFATSVDHHRKIKTPDTIFFTQEEQRLLETKIYKNWFADAVCLKTGAVLHIKIGRETAYKLIAALSTHPKLQHAIKIYQQNLLDIYRNPPFDLARAFQSLTFLHNSFNDNKTLIQEQLTALR